jgi:hypothetical protein
VAKDSRKIDYADFRRAVGFDLTLSQQDKISAACRLPISPKIWEEIIQATARYTLVQSAMQHAPEVESLHEPLKQFKKSSIKLRKIISDRPELDANPLDVSACSAKLPGATKGNLFELYVSLLDWVIGYTSIIQEMHAAGYVIGYKGSGAWQDWVAQLAAIMERHGLPAAAVRHKKLPFHSLISNLHAHMGLQCRRYDHSERSLAEGIQSVLKAMAK